MLTGDLGAIGVGWIIWRSAEYLPKDLIFELHYLGAVSSLIYIANIGADYVDRLLVQPQLQ